MTAHEPREGAPARSRGAAPPGRRPAVSPADGPGTVLGLDNVRLALPVAGAGSRLLAGTLDYSILGALWIAWIVGAFALVTWLDLGWGWGLALVLLGVFVLEYGYFAGTEVALGGRTLGKLAVGLRVITAAGGHPGAGALAVRNLVRSVDLFVGVPLIAFDPLSRRLGDRLAGTLVAHARPRAPEPSLGRIPRGWGTHEVAVVEGFLRRAADLEPWRAEKMARALLTCVERDDPELLAGVARERESLLTLRNALAAQDL